MSHQNNSFTSKYGTTLKTEEDADALIKMMKEQLQYYKTRNTEYEHVFSKLRITPDSLSFESRESLDKFVKLQDAAGANNSDIDVELSFLEFATNKYKYQSQSRTLKDQIEELSELTDKVKTDIKKIECEINSAQNQIQSLHPPPDELGRLDIQLKTYEEKFSQFINKYPWIDGPQYNMLSIQNEIKKLIELQIKVEKLEKKLECYEGLKPDLFLAKRQLNTIKAEYEEISKMIANMKL